MTTSPVTMCSCVIAGWVLHPGHPLPRAELCCEMGVITHPPCRCLVSSLPAAGSLPESCMAQPVNTLRSSGAVAAQDPSQRPDRSVNIPANSGAQGSGYCTQGCEQQTDGRADRTFGLGATLPVGRAERELPSTHPVVGDHACASPASSPEAGHHDSNIAGLQRPM